MFSAVRSLAHGRPRTLLAIILVVAVLARLAFWFAIVGFGTTGGGDEPDYHRLAAGLADGSGFLTKRGEPTAERPPLYPTLLAGLYTLTGPNPDAARALQVALGALIVLLVYVLADRLFGRSVALLAAALAAVNPGLIYLSALIMTENLYVVLLLWALVLLVDTREGKGVPPGRAVAVGVLLGLAALARPTGLVVAFAIAAGVALLGRGRPTRRLATGALIAVLALVTIAPWTVRNHARLDRWVLFTTHGGITFYESNTMLNYEVPEFRGIVVLPRHAVPRWDEIHALPEAESDALAWRLGVEFIREHPREFAHMAWWKLARFWRVQSGLTFGDAAGAAGGGGALRGLLSRVDVLGLYWMVVLPLFLLGLVVTARRWRRLHPLYAVLLGHVLLAIAFHGSIRARMPVEPVITIMAAAAIGWLAGLRTRRSAALPPESGAGIS